MQQRTTNTMQEQIYSMSFEAHFTRKKRSISYHFLQKISGIKPSKICQIESGKCKASEVINYLRILENV